MNDFFRSLLVVTGEMSPYLLLGFLIAGILHVFVPGTFYHHLYIFCPSTLGQFSKPYQFFNLTYITCVCKTTRATSIPQRNRDVIFTANI